MVQFQAHQRQENQQPRQRQGQGQVHAGGDALAADIELMREFLVEKRMDWAGHFGMTIACMIRPLPSAVSGEAMVKIMQFLTELNRVEDQ